MDILTLGAWLIGEECCSAHVTKLYFAFSITNHYVFGFQAKSEEGVNQAMELTLCTQFPKNANAQVQVACT